MGLSSTMQPERRRVLVVDDNRDAADSLCALLGIWGYEGRTAYDGQSALKEAAEFRPDCLVLDIGLPGMDGFELARAIRGQPDHRQVKLIALTAYAGEDWKQRVTEAGFDHHLVKPADPREVQRILAMMNEVKKLAQETKELLGEARQELRETKEEIREVKQELREVKVEIREIRRRVE